MALPPWDGPILRPLPYVDRLVPYRGVFPDLPAVVGEEPRRDVDVGGVRVPP